MLQVCFPLKSVVLLPIWETWSPFYVIHVSLRTSESISRTASLSAQLFCRAYQCFQQANTHTRLQLLFPGLPWSAGTRKVKPIWMLLKQETVSGSDISWTICKSAPRSRQIITPAPHHSVFTGKHTDQMKKITVKNQNYLISNGVLLTVM